MYQPHSNTLLCNTSSQAHSATAAESIFHTYLMQRLMICVMNKDNKQQIVIEQIIASGQWSARGNHCIQSPIQIPQCGPLFGRWQKDHMWFAKIWTQFRLALTHECCCKQWRVFFCFEAASKAVYGLIWSLTPNPPRDDIHLIRVLLWSRLSIKPQKYSVIFCKSSWNLYFDKYWFK